MMRIGVSGIGLQTLVTIGSPPVGGRDRDAPQEGDAKTPATRTLQGLDWLNFFLADVQTGIGPFLSLYLAGYGWAEERVGIALTVGGIAGILTQTPAGALVDRLRPKRALITAGIAALAVGALLIALAPTLRQPTRTYEAEVACL